MKLLGLLAGVSEASAEREPAVEILSEQSESKDLYGPKRRGKR
jgi:hypothetical protein